MTAKQLQNKLTSLKEKIGKRRTELADLNKQQKDLRDQLVAAKATEKANPKKSGKAQKKK